MEDNGRVRNVSLSLSSPTSDADFTNRNCCNISSLIAPASNPELTELLRRRTTHGKAGSSIDTVDLVDLTGGKRTAIT